MRTIDKAAMTGELDIMYRDRSIMVVNKPGDLLAVPGRGPEKQDCIVSRARSLYPEMLEQPAVHRLDQQTSGIMVLAMHSSAHRHLSSQFQNRRVKKGYVAIVEKTIEALSGTLTLPFRLDPDNRPYQIYDPVHGKEAITHWCKIGYDRGGTRISFTPLTGRTHQLRVHSAHPGGLDSPIIGDRLYGSGTEGDTMLLHASYLSFYHPENERIVEFHSPPSF
ncbi:MAG: RluA family pseudouridine synthase [Desulfocapsaceae bacterium]